MDLSMLLIASSSTHEEDFSRRHKVVADGVGLAVKAFLETPLVCDRISNGDLRDPDELLDSNEDKAWCNGGA